MAAVNEIVVPDIGDFSDVPVIEVLVAPGDTVAENDPLIVLESDKATMEVPAPGAGTVESVAVGVGDKVSQGDVIVVLVGGDGAGESPSDSDADESGEDGPEAAVDDESERVPEPDTSRQADGDAEPSGDDATETASPPAPVVAAEPANGARTPRTPSSTDGRPAAGPAARRAARELGIDLATIAGSGRAGRITLEDVARAARDAGQGAGATSGLLAGLPDWPTPDFAAFGEIERVPLSRIARIAGPSLARNWVAIPHVTQFDEADITDLEAFRKEVNADHADEGVKVTMVSLLLKACSSALREFPTFNSSLDGDELVLKRYHHLGFAADTPAGLMVPVIRDVDRKGLLGIARELTDLSAAARDGSIKREQMQGGTFTISSLGGIGGTAFTPIINAPEVAILGVSRAKTSPVWDGRGFSPRLMLPLSLSYDHRVIDGAEAARFTTRLTELLRDPREMLL